MNEEFTWPEETISSYEDYLEMTGQYSETEFSPAEEHVLGEVLEQQLAEQQLMEAENESNN